MLQKCVNVYNFFTKFQLSGTNFHSLCEDDGNFGFWLFMDTKCDTHRSQWPSGLGRVYGRLLAGIAGSNPAGGIDSCPL